MKFYNFKYTFGLILLSILSGCSQYDSQCCPNQTSINETISKGPNIVMLRQAEKQKKDEVGTVVEKKSSEDNQPEKSSEVINDDIKITMDNSIPDGMDKNNNYIMSIYFDFDKYSIRDDMREILKNNSLFLQGKKVLLEGNCDEFGSDEYNFALGLKRANAVKVELEKFNISAETMEIKSLGESNPVCLEFTSECWAKNRRVDFKIK